MEPPEDGVMNEMKMSSRFEAEHATCRSHKLPHLSQRWIRVGYAGPTLTLPPIG